MPQGHSRFIPSRRQTGDPRFEAKLGAGDLLVALLRLHLRAFGIVDPGVTDWTF